MAWLGTLCNGMCSFSVKW